MNPKISIVIPSYNRPDFLQRLLRSIANQTFQEYEVIIVDDCSPKREEIIQVVDTFRKEIFSIQLVENVSNQGAPYSRNVGINLSQADWIALVDDDDEWMPEKLEKQYAIIANGPHDLGIVYTWADVIEDGKVIRREASEFRGKVLDQLLKSNFIPSSSVVAKKSALLEAGVFDEAFHSCQDWDMWVRILSKGYFVEVVKSSEIIFYKHGCGSIGLSETAIEGYRQFYRKHIHKYRAIDPYFYYTFRVKNWLRNFLRRNEKTAKENSLI